MMDVIDILKPFFSRILAGVLAALGAVLIKKFHFDLGPEATQALHDAGLLVLYAVVHRATNRTIHPDDTAK